MIRRWVLAGLIVWIPLGATLLVIRFILDLLDSSKLLPQSWRFPGLGVLLTVAVVLATGALAANSLGAQVLGWVESLLDHIPLVRSLYGGTKKLAETLFSGNSNSFRKVVMIEWPRPGMWSVGFLAGEPLREAAERTGKEMSTVFVPTTPNPTSGFLMQVARDEVVPLNLSVEEGMRYIISLGVAPPNRPTGAAVGALPPSAAAPPV